MAKVCMHSITTRMNVGFELEGENGERVPICEKPLGENYA